MGGLTIVATPIGNLDDITLRALRVLREATLILAEDTRRTRTLCQHHGIDTQLRSFHQHTDEARLEQLATEIAQGRAVALVSDAGTPVISDPGARLVARVVALGGRVETAPGPSAVTAAVSVAGLRADHFTFLGFLPRSGSRRTRQLWAIAESTAASVLFEAPGRIATTLRELAEVCGDGRRAALCRELTKLHEEVARGTLAELRERFAEGARGELTLVVEGHDGVSALPDRGAQAPAADLDTLIGARLADGQPAKQIARELSRSLRLDRRAVYGRVVALKRADSGEQDPAGG